MTDQPEFPHSYDSADRAMGHARVEFAEMLFAEASDVGAAPQPSTELTAQVQASALLALYYEMRHGNDLREAQIRALDAHRLALAEYAGHHLETPALMAAVQVGEPELPPARAPLD
ncbi:hypothetical protein [Kibdelosporangium phytohabitans]|uniref:Uncharacterized protein n=1 Tax=Kibdelosporangium phytohabitans TaxID=860235 RepID=A0A0N9HW81_9PSEU|nr:hypothetical protein [Kibdelosporangium phytohabitans]ALG09496.1 hypothetical protein AOZ06_23615 [Kibdelosporangium phytohabitans]MBE1469204.1 hypothetical protein [Kibdelosporangium phytohabitans]